MSSATDMFSIVPNHKPAGPMLLFLERHKLNTKIICSCWINEDDEIESNGIHLLPNGKGGLLRAND